MVLGNIKENKLTLKALQDKLDKLESDRSNINIEVEKEESLQCFFP